MKKLLLGLLALASVSSFASEYVNVKAEVEDGIVKVAISSSWSSDCNKKLTEMKKDLKSGNKVITSVSSGCSSIGGSYKGSIEYLKY